MLKRQSKYNSLLLKCYSNSAHDIIATLKVMCTWTGGGGVQGSRRVAGGAPGGGAGGRLGSPSGAGAEEVGAPGSLGAPVSP